MKDRLVESRRYILKTLPDNLIGMCQFSNTPMSQWMENEDIRVFAQSLYPPESSFGRDVCLDEEKPMRKHARLFTEQLMEKSSMSDYIDFYQDSYFGRMAKHVIAMKCCTKRLLEDAEFYSLAHVLEANSDIECSLLLAANFYYKQAILMLRGVLEEAILPIHFCDTVADFDKWKANNYRTPALRGNNGLLKRLSERGIIDASTVQLVDELYRRLNSYVHGSENTLIHKNIHLGGNDGLGFNLVEFMNFCDMLCGCVKLCIFLWKINYDQWSVIRATKFESLAKLGKTLCHTCHNEDSFDRWFLPSKYCHAIQEKDGEKTNMLEDIADLSFYQYVCKKCGNKIMVNAQETSLDMVICFSIEGMESETSITQFAHLVRGTEDAYCEWYTVQEEGMDYVTPLLAHIDG